MSKLTLLINYDDIHTLYYVNDYSVDYDELVNDYNIIYDNDIDDDPNGVKIEIEFGEWINMLHTLNDKRKYGYVTMQDGKIYHKTEIKENENAKLVYDLIDDMYYEMSGEEKEYLLTEYIFMLERNMKKHTSKLNDVISNLI